MLRRTRTTKTLAQRMDLQYFKRPHAFRSWRLWLSISIPVVAVIWLFARHASGEKIYSSGPLSASHAAFGKKCEVCHAGRGGTFRKEVSDRACLTCHDAPAHHSEKVSFTPSCGSCHLEHKGSLQLANTLDLGCTQCHANLSLHLKNTNTTFVTDISGFDAQHPEFAVLRTGAKDPGKIKLNHVRHLIPKLAGPNGPVQLDCGDCHRPSGMEGAWPYPAQAGMTGETPPPVKVTARAYMAPIRYTDQCAGCHVKDLQFDKRFADVVPHDRVEVVQAFLYRKYSEYFASHPDALSEPISPERILPGKFNPPPLVPHNREEWIALQVDLSDRILWGKGCKLCHTILPSDQLTPSALPKITPSNTPVRWLQHAEFDHEAHRLLTCTACHTKSPTSQETADVLIPGIATCRNCHKESGPLHDAARGQCSECHSYHDWTKEQPIKGKFTIQQLRASR